MAQPVEGDELAAAVLPRDLEEHGADERHPRVDGGATEGVLHFEGYLDVLDHVGEELELLQLAERIKTVIDRRKGDEDVH